MTVAEQEPTTMAAPAKKPTPAKRRSAKKSPLSLVQPQPTRQKVTQPAMAALAASGAKGHTTKEIAALLSRDTRPVSGALSTKHGRGGVLMLEETRDGSHIYVLPQHAGNRPLRARRSNKHSKERALAIVEHELAQALNEAADHLGRVSVERVMREFKAIVA